MIKKKEKILPLSLALRSAVYSNDEQSLISYIAEKNCWNITTFRNSLCPTTTTHKANIYHLEAVLAETQDSGIMDSICAIHGNAAWFELPKVEVLSSSDFVMKVGKLAHENGDLTQSIVAAIKDSVINEDELEVIRKDAHDLIRVAATLLAMAELLHQHEL